ncbi:MAG: ABC transporter permease [Candidatus Omnitrophica bacterium]|nr:ABC transporter permease [Candidatus Omnitrophota bacterium]
MTKRKEKFLRLISVISVLGVVVGVAALIVVISVMNGFDEHLQDKIIGNTSHLILIGDFSEDLEATISKLKSVPEIKAISPFLQGQALIKTKEKLFAIGLKGIVPASEPGVSKIEEYLISGSLSSLDENSVIVGRELAWQLGLIPGKQFSLIAPSAKTYNLKVSGIFDSGMYEYDTGLLFMHINLAKTILKESGVRGMAIKLFDLNQAQAVKSKLQNLLGYNYIVKTWIDLNANFFAALKLEKITMFIILSLVVMVAAFNIASTLIVMVVQKTKDIGILKSIGMSNKRIHRIFTFEGLIIGIMGVAFGLGLGIGLCFLLKKYHFIKLPADVYNLEYLPVALRFYPDLTVIAVCALVITLLATIYPARRASFLNPVEALRYE